MKVKIQTLLQQKHRSNWRLQKNDWIEKNLELFWEGQQLAQKIALWIPILHLCKTRKTNEDKQDH